MKKILLSILLVLPLIFTACQNNIEPYVPGEEDASNCYGVYFPSQEATGSHTLDPTMETKATFTAMRKNANGAITVPLTVSASEDGIFNVGALTFADGQTETTFDVTFPNAGTGVEYSLSVQIDDPAYASKYQNQPIAFDYSCLRVEWIKFGHATFYEGWWGEEHTANIKYYETNGVRTCVAECDEGNGIWGDDVDVTFNFTWYTNKFNDEGMQVIDVPKQYFGFDYDDWKSKPQGSCGNAVFFYDWYNYLITDGGYSPSNWDGPDDFYEKNGASYPRSYYDGNGGFYFNLKYHIPGLGGWTPDVFDVEVIVDGFNRADYSMEIETDYSHDGEVPAYFTVGNDVATIKFAVYPGELTATQIENKVNGILGGTEEFDVIDEFEEGDGEKYADLALSFDETGFFTLVAVGFDANKVAQSNASVLLNYVSKEDEGELKCIIDCGTEDVPSRYTGYNKYDSFAFFVKGEDIVEAHIGLYTVKQVKEDLEGVMNNLKYETEPVSDAVLAQINANGGYYDIASDLKGETEYWLIVWATNGMTEADAAAVYTTEPLPYVWKSLGTGLYTEDIACGLYGIDPITVECEVFEEASHPGLFTIKGFEYNVACAAFDGKVSPEEMIEYEGLLWEDCGMLIDATNPKDVRINFQEYGICFNTDEGMVDGITSVYNGAPFSVGTYENGIISFPTVKGLLCTLDGDGYYYGNQHGAFQVILPGVDKQSVPVGTNSVLKNNPKANKTIAKAKETFEREAKQASFTSKKIAHKTSTPAKEQKPSREAAKNVK